MSVCSVGFKHAASRKRLQLCWKALKNICHERKSLPFFGARATLVCIDQMLLFHSSPCMGAAGALTAPKAAGPGDVNPEFCRGEIANKSSLWRVLPHMGAEKSKMVKPVKTPLVGRSTLQIICSFLGALPSPQPQLLKTFFFSNSLLLVSHPEECGID